MSDVVFNNHLLLFVIERLGIDLGFSEKTIAEVCLEAKINPQVFITISNLYNNVEGDSIDNFSYTDIKDIINYLKKSHRYYLEEKFPEIKNNIQIMISENDESQIQLLANFYEEYLKEVSEHINYENRVVFPFIIEMIDNIKNAKKTAKSSNYSVIEYKEHHEDIEEKLQDLKSLLIKYLHQKHDKIIRRKILFDLFDLEYDLNIHSRIEDNILIPFVEKMELETIKA
jgi:regulator of cell morphogenesis and NO signaling